MIPLTLYLLSLSLSSPPSLPPFYSTRVFAYRDPALIWPADAHRTCADDHYALFTLPRVCRATRPQTRSCITSGSYARVLARDDDTVRTSRHTREFRRGKNRRLQSNETHSRSVCPQDRVSEMAAEMCAQCCQCHGATTCRNT